MEVAPDGCSARRHEWLGFDRRADGHRKGAALAEAAAGLGTLPLFYLTGENETGACPFPSWFGHRDRRKKRSRVRVGGAKVDLVRIPLFNDLPEVHDGDAVAEVTDDGQVLRDEQVGQACLAGRAEG
jgi:hypothetical protein